MTRDSAGARVKIGKLGKPHGVRGELRLWTDNPDSETPRKGLTLHCGAEQFLIISCKRADKFFIVRLEGIDDRNQAATLTNQEVEVDREDLPAPTEDEFYQIDLLGLPVEDRDGKSLGVVDGFLDDVDTDVMVVRSESSSDKLLVPLVGHVVEVFKPGHPIVIAPLNEWGSEE